MATNDPATSSSGTVVNLNTVYPDAQITKTVITTGGQRVTFYELQRNLAETELDNKHRRDQEVIDNEQRRKQEGTTFTVLLWVGGIIVTVCLFIIGSKAIPALAQTFSDGQVVWAQTALASLFTGIVGYVTGSRKK